MPGFVTDGWLSREISRTNRDCCHEFTGPALQDKFPADLADHNVFGVLAVITTQDARSQVDRRS